MWSYTIKQLSNCSDKHSLIADFIQLIVNCYIRLVIYLISDTLKIWPEKAFSKLYKFVGLSTTLDLLLNIVCIVSYSCRVHAGLMYLPSYWLCTYNSVAVNNGSIGHCYTTKITEILWSQALPYFEIVHLGCLKKIQLSFFHRFGPVFMLFHQICWFLQKGWHWDWWI